ncbi:hypothetical protein EAG_02354 [Camponotus floridanus]|uniref:Uncharacterized protein n=1 Tax=Camponotus floridanus TaxID=104421 RepID=E2AR55_CAMFO|nr:hypothetical protein EAG_02354 [Camponotus floridanus]
MSILALPWVRQVNSLCGRHNMVQKPFCDDTVAGADGGTVDDVGAAIGGEGVATRDIVRDGVPNGDAEEAGEGHRDGDGDDLAELLRE